MSPCILIFWTSQICKTQIIKDWVKFSDSYLKYNEQNSSAFLCQLATDSLSSLVRYVTYVRVALRACPARKDSNSVALQMGKGM